MFDYEFIGYRLEISVLFWLVIACLALGAILLVLQFFLRDDWTDIFGFFSGVFALILAGVLAFIAVPFDSSYWKYQKVEGEITNVSNTLSDDGGELTRQITFTVDDDPTIFTTEDARLTQLEGRDVTLRCTKEWIYLSAPKYSCVPMSVND